MTTQRGDAPSRPTVAVGLFPTASAADGALERARAGGFSGRRLVRDEAGTIPEVLARYGVPNGEARFYQQSVGEGQALVVLDAAGRYDEARDLLGAAGGEDARRLGKELVRGQGAEAHPPDMGAAPGPVEGLTDHWEDVESRYEMLWAQRFGSGNGTWEQAEPVYRFAWEMANRPDWRGRHWDEVAPALQQAWRADGMAPSWDEVKSAVRDVWEDVADEARRGAEGADQLRTRKPFA